MCFHDLKCTYLQLKLLPRIVWPQIFPRVHVTLNNKPIHIACLSFYIFSLWHWRRFGSLGNANWNMIYFWNNNNNNQMKTLNKLHIVFGWHSLCHHNFLVLAFVVVVNLPVSGMHVRFAFLFLTMAPKSSSKIPNTFRDTDALSRMPKNICHCIHSGRHPILKRCDFGLFFPAFIVIFILTSKLCYF